MRLSFFAASSAVLLLATQAHAAAPQWIDDAISAPCSLAPGDAPALVLFDERRTVVDATGRSRTRRRMVTRILRAGKTGRDSMVVGDSAHTKVLTLKAWSRLASGKTLTAKEKDAVETSPSNEYSDVKVKILGAPASVPGTVVAFEVETEDRWFGMEDVWIVDDVVPTCVTRYELELAPGWTHDARWVRTGATEPRVEGNRWTWERRSVPALPVEEMMPSVRASSGALTVRFVPPAGFQGTRGTPTWRDLGASYSALAGSRTEADEAIKQLAASLATSESQTENIAALAAFAQRDVRYVAIELGIGGLQPRPASSVLRNRFGDCKDKAALLVAMLGTIGVHASLVLVNTDRGAVLEEFPTYGAFNHAIVTIRHALPDAPAHSGELLFFDPTDDRVPFGELPHALQGSPALVVTADGGELVRLPVAPSRANGTERKIRIVVEDGVAHAVVEETHRGADASILRGLLKAATVAQRSEVVRRRITLRDAEVAGLAVKNLEPSREPLTVSYRVIAPGLLTDSGDLKIFRASLFDAWPAPFAAKERRAPLELPYTWIDEESIELPLGTLTLDEEAKPLEVDAAFARYASRVEQKDGKLLVRRTREVKKLYVDAKELSAKRELLKKAADDAKRAIVLKSR